MDAQKKVSVEPSTIHPLSSPRKRAEQLPRKHYRHGRVDTAMSGQSRSARLADYATETATARGGGRARKAVRDGKGAETIIAFPGSQCRNITRSAGADEGFASPQASR
ncbi:hypothetical protein NKR23_g7129 [Pleurostoma richardsiae]|uniref:Uncharacterized protein n=1 Tax=Pleurostoma richardsiae TaxID=41990 RepID=A0AA38RJ75_9PEZI|nr:hypothetical protein NKR23_g7129 [Pleurostoma richardsiae]